MWNVYSERENGQIVLEAEDCGSEELAWDVVEYMNHTENCPYPLWVEFKGVVNVVS
jgi:hypothetical protein